MRLLAYLAIRLISERDCQSMHNQRRSPWSLRRCRLSCFRRNQEARYKFLLIKDFIHISLQEGHQEIFPCKANSMACLTLSHTMIPHYVPSSSHEAAKIHKPLATNQRYMTRTIVSYSKQHKIILD